MKKILFFAACIILFSGCFGGGKFNIEKDGGVVYTLETDAADFLQKSASYYSDTNFVQVLQEARQASPSNGNALIVAFVNKYNDRGHSPLPFFVRRSPEKYKPGMSNDELIKKLLDEYDKANTIVEHIISNRIKHFGIDESDFNIYQDKNKKIIIEINGVADVQRFRKLVQASADLKFFETWDNVEAYTYFDKLNKELAAEMLLQVDTTMPIDSTSQAYRWKENPVFSKLQLAVRPDEFNRSYSWEKGCRIGMADIADTSALNQMFKGKKAGYIFPLNLHLYWALNTEGEPVGPGMVSLYLIKSMDVLRPALDGKVITDAHVDAADNNRPVVTFNMDQDGAAEWAGITSRNVGKGIAITLDNRVISAPTVETEITGGTSTISGNFTESEAQDLANILKNASFPVRARIVDEKKVEPRK